MPILNVYTELIQYEEIGGDMTDRIDRLNLHVIFEPIITHYPDRSKFNSVLFFILHVYSKEGTAIIPGQDYLQCKERLADRLKIKDEQLREDILYLRCPEIVKTVQRYLKLQMSKTLEHLTMKRELYQQMLTSAMMNLTNKDGGTDYDQKFSNSEYADKLYDQIHDWEQRLMDENKELKQAMEELRAVKQRRNISSLRIEDNLNED
jgi:hypothetical protein